MVLALDPNECPRQDGMAEPCAARPCVEFTIEVKARQRVRMVVMLSGMPWQFRFYCSKVMQKLYD